MRYRATLVLLLILPLPAVAQEEPSGPVPADRLVSLTAGVGNAMGWFGAQGERYVADERLSIYVGVGYTPRLDGGDTGPTFAAGLRTFTSGVKHRAFVEGSVSQVLVETGTVNAGRRLYGPGVQIGYQFVSRGGFTLMASTGVGYALAGPRSADPWAAQVGVGVGYTWRRSGMEGSPLRRTK